MINFYFMGFKQSVFVQTICLILSVFSLGLSRGDVPSLTFSDNLLTQRLLRSYLIADGGWVSSEKSSSVVDMYQNYPPFDSQLVEKQKLYVLAQFEAFESEILKKSDICQNEKKDFKKIKEELSEQRSRHRAATKFNSYVKRCFKKLVEKAWTTTIEKLSRIDSIFKANEQAKVPLFKFKLVSAGEFIMGNKDTRLGKMFGEQAHLVKLTKSFEIMICELTQKEWVQVMGYNPSFFKTKSDCSNNHEILGGVEICPSRPVENVSWFDVQNYIQRLNQISNDMLFRLPSEAEWEFAARGNSEEKYFFKDLKKIDKYV